MNSAQFLSLTPHRGVVCFPNYLDSKAHDGHPKSLSRHRGPGLTGQLAERGAQPTILRDILCGDHTCGDRTWSCELDARMRFAQKAVDVFEFLNLRARVSVRLGQ